MIHSPHSVTARPAFEDSAQIDQAKELFEDHVPMSLIMDLNPPEGPHSQDILDSEGAPAAAWWDRS